MKEMDKIIGYYSPETGEVCCPQCGDPSGFPIVDVPHFKELPDGTLQPKNRETTPLPCAKCGVPLGEKEEA